MKKLTECLHVIQGNRSDIENWIKRGILATKFQDTVPGKARLLSRANVKELALVSNFVNAGCRPLYAVDLAGEIMKDEGTARMKEWLVVKVGDWQRAVSTDAIDTAFAEPTTISAVPIAAILRQVEDFFDQATAKAKA